MGFRHRFRRGTGRARQPAFQRSFGFPLRHIRPISPLRGRAGLPQFSRYRPLPGDDQLGISRNFRRALSCQRSTRKRTPFTSTIPPQKQKNSPHQALAVEQRGWACQVMGARVNQTVRDTKGLSRKCVCISSLTGIQGRTASKSPPLPHPAHNQNRAERVANRRASSRAKSPST
jgi:hypothetical protein